MASTGRGDDRPQRVAEAIRAKPAADLGRSTYPTHVIDEAGLPTAVLVEMPHTHTAVIEVFVRSGSAYESQDNNGISHFLEHVVLASSRDYPTRADLQAAIDSTGGFLDAVTHQELTEFSFLVVPEQVEPALKLLGEALVRPSFSPPAVEAERQIVLEELITGKYEGAKDPFAEILWGTDSVGLPIIGRREVVEEVSVEDLRKFWERRYTRENTLICVAGGADRESVLRALESFRGGPTSPGRVDRPARARSQDRPAFHIERYASGTTDACLMLRTPGWESAEPELHTILALVTQYYHTHVYQSLIGPALPVYYLYTGQETFITEGYIYFYFNVARKRFFATLSRVIQEIDRMLQEGIPERDLEVAKRRYRLSVLANLDDPRDVAYRLGSDLLLSGRERAVSIEEELAQVERVTGEDVNRALERLFVGRNLCVVARGGLGWWRRRALRRRLEHWLPETES